MTFGDWWRSLSTGARVVIAAVALAVVVNASLAATDSLLGGDPGGPVSSATSTGGDGLAAYADLLRAEGHPVTRVRDELGPGDLPAGATVVVADPRSLSGPDGQALLGFVDDGGRLVVAGESSAPLLAAATGTSVTWVPGASVDELAVWLPTADTGVATSVVGDRGGRWRDLGPLVPLAGARTGPAIVAGPAGSGGKGHVIALADAEPLQNDRLARADNAALALALAGGADAPVVFVEPSRVDGPTGLAAVPPAWKWMALGLLVTVLAGVWAAGRRFGPAEPQQRELRPPRLDHVAAVAAGLDRRSATAAEAVAPLAARTRRELAEHLRVAPDASYGVLHRAATDAGIDPAEVDLVATEPADLDRALVVGALAAHRRRARLGTVLAAEPGPTAADRSSADRPLDPDPHPGAPS